MRKTLDKLDEDMFERGAMRVVLLPAVGAVVINTIERISAVRAGDAFPSFLCHLLNKSMQRYEEELLLHHTHEHSVADSDE